MRFFRLALCVIGAISIALFVPNIVREVSLQRQTGIGAAAGGLAESVFSLLFWILAVLCFSLFLWASRNRQALVRVLLFWIPSVASSVLGIALLGLFTYMYLHFRQT